VFKSLSEAELFVFVTMSCCNDHEVPKKKNRRFVKTMGSRWLEVHAPPRICYLHNNHRPCQRTVTAFVLTPSRDGRQEGPVGHVSKGRPQRDRYRA